MNPFDAVQQFFDHLARNLVILGLLVAAVVAAYLHLAREPNGAERLQKANPGWTVKAVDGRPVRVDDGSGRGEVMLSADDIGPYRIERVDCAEVRPAFPKWFSLPDAPPGNCLRIVDSGRTTFVLNMRTPMRITQLWDRQYAPLIDRLKLGYSGGRSGRFPEGAQTDLPAGQPLPEERGAASYSIGPPEGSGERIVAMSFYRWAGTTELIFTFRPPPT